MHVRKLALGVSALALALPTAAAVPAQAANHHRGGDPRILDIGNIRVDDGDAEIRIRFSCDSDDEGELRVRVRQHHARAFGHEDVECDGRDRATVELDSHGRDDLEEGRAWVSVVLRADGERDRDEDSVRVREDHRRHR